MDVLSLFLFALGTLLVSLVLLALLKLVGRSIKEVVFPTSPAEKSRQLKERERLRREALQRQERLKQEAAERQKERERLRREALQRQERLKQEEIDRQERLKQEELEKQRLYEEELAKQRAWEESPMGKIQSAAKDVSEGTVNVLLSGAGIALMAVLQNKGKSGGQVKVSSYRKKDGTRVKSHTRHRPR